MTSTVQWESNRRNALRSTGPRTADGKARSAQNATKHGLTGQLFVGLRFGLFADDPEELQAFVDQVMAELAPRTTQERSEALHIAGLLVRRSRLVEFEALALAHSTRAPVRPAAEPGGPSTIAESALTRAGADALSCDLFDRLPRYEGHLSRELDRSLARYARLQADPRGREQAIDGELVDG